MKSPEKDIDFIGNKYSEDQIRSYIKENKIEDSYWFWYCISIYQTLSEDFIKEFQDKVNWYRISIYQTLSEEFMVKNIDNIVIGKGCRFGLISNKKIPEKVKNRIINLKRIRSL